MIEFEAADVIIIKEQPGLINEIQEGQQVFEVRVTNSIMMVVNICLSANEIARIVVTCRS